MTKGLAGMLAIAIVFLVTVVMGEGGPLDNFVGGSADERPAAGESAQADERDTVLASRVTPTPEPTSAALSWFEEDTASADFAPPPQRPQPQPRARSGGASEVGALARHRQNLEE